MSALKAGIWRKKIVENGKNDQFNDEIETKSSFLWQPNAKNRWFWVRAIKEPTFHQKVWGLWVTAETISKNKGSLSDSSAENRGSLEPHIRVTSIMGVPPPPNIPPLMFFLETLNGVVILINPVLSDSIQRSQIIKNTKHKLRNNNTMLQCLLCNKLKS